MKQAQNLLLLSVVLLLAIACNTAETSIDFKHPNLTYEGRITYQDTAAELTWSGVSVSMLFEGTGVSATLQGLDTANYYNIIVDGKVVSKLHTDTIKKTYTLATGLPKGEHEIQLFKRTEWDKGKTLFYGFRIDEGGTVCAPSALPKRKIEFYGNSITCGYANEDFEGKDRWFGYFENNYKSYAAITARHFDAQYHCISKSGIGIMVSWFPMIMPEMYDRADPFDSTSVWNFNNYTPDVVVVNLLQNDSWLVNMSEHESFKSRFGVVAPDSVKIVSAYKDFISSIRAKYPKADIVCALGNMDAVKEGSRWPTLVQTAVSELSDTKVHCCFFSYKNTPNHPLVEEQEAMANQLIQFIEKKIDW